MAISNASNRLAWLAFALDAQRSRLAALLRHMTGMGAPEAMNPSFLHKFLLMLDQIASARAKEMRILDKIEAVEEQHKFRREHHQLEHFAADPLARPELGPDEQPNTTSPKKGLLWLLLFWKLFAGKPE